MILFLIWTLVTRFILAHVSMATSFKTSLPVILLLMTAGLDGQYYYGRVNYNPSYVCALKDSTVKLFCRVTHPPLFDITTAYWIKANDDYPGLCFQTGINKDTHSMTLTHVTEADKHRYYCRFTTLGITVAWTDNVGVQLDVTDLQVETQQRVKEGDSVTLTCKTTCRLTEETTFIWYRNNQRLTEVNQLHLPSVSRDDSGVYRCAAVRGREHLSSPPYNLTVRYSPEKTSVSIRPSGVIVEGDSVNLICSSESNPPAHEFSWFKGGKFVGSGKIYSITNIRSAHSGKYKCKSRNEHGEKESNAVMLNVMYPPKNVVASIRPSGVIVEGDSVNLTCSSESNPPVHEISWFKENESESVGSGQTFSITNINFSHTGGFYCVAQNQYGSERSAAVSVTVKGKSRAENVIMLVVIAAVVITSVILMVAIGMCIRRKRVTLSEERNNRCCRQQSKPPEEAYMTLDPQSRCADYDTLHNMKRCGEHTRNREAQDATYYNFDN